MIICDKNNQSASAGFVLISGTIELTKEISMAIQNSTQTHTQLESPIPCGADEISVVELYKVLSRRKRTIISTVIFTLFVAVVYLWLANPVYEGDVVIQVGRIGQSDLIEDVGKLMSRLKIEFPTIEKISREGSFLTITVNDDSEVKVEKILKKIIKDLIDRHSIIYDEKIFSQQKKYEFLKGRIDEIKNRITELTSNIDVMIKTKPVKASTLIMTQIELLKTLAILEEEKNKLGIGEMQREPTKIIQSPFVIEHPIRPKKRLVVVLSIFLGIILGVLNAFIIELADNEKQKNKHK